MWVNLVFLAFPLTSFSLRFYSTHKVRLCHASKWAQIVSSKSFFRSIPCQIPRTQPMPFLISKTEPIIASSLYLEPRWSLGALTLPRRAGRINYPGNVGRAATPAEHIKTLTIPGRDLWKQLPRTSSKFCP